MTEIHFDAAYNPERPIFVLANRSGNKLGGLQAKKIRLKGSMMNADEVSFVVYKYENGILNPLWDKIVDFKLIWNKESDLWYEIKVELDESAETIKNVSGKQLGNAELSQLNIYSTEINTENDIAREDYVKPTVLYDPENPNSSLLHRIGEKAKHYEIAHVDDTIRNIQRTFTFDDISIVDSHNQISEEIGCLFVYHSDSNEDGRPRRAYSVYDLQSNCECGYRGEFTGKCPECGSANITEGYGEDTTIFVTADELAENLQFTTDTAAVKNCFKLEAGDALMTAAIRSCNPNGSDYMWYISDAVKKDMSEELSEKIEAYNDAYDQYQNEYKIYVNSESYNLLAENYNAEPLSDVFIGYPSLMEAYFSTIDLALYLESAMMPDATMANTTAIEQAALLTASNLSPVAVANIDVISKASADNAVLAMAKVIVDSRYRVKIDSSSFNEDSKIWQGNFSVVNYSNEDDKATSAKIQIVISGDYEEYVEQKLEKALNDKAPDDLSIAGLFEMESADFDAELRKYCLKRLESFHDACQACIDILIEQDVANAAHGEDLKTRLYTPYYNKLMSIEAEMQTRQNEIDLTKAMQIALEDERAKIQDVLDFEKFIKRNADGNIDEAGEALWIEFCAYRREDKYSNNNYISDGLTNAEIFANAKAFLEAAQNEIVKSAELQHSISSTLKNLLVIEKFKALVRHFKTGNWLRVLVDEKIYKLRLLEYEIDFDDLDTLSVEFSDVLKIANGISDQQAIMSKLSSMATTYDAVQRQASQGAKSNEVVQSWFEDGLNATNINIVSGANNQTQKWDEHGMLFRAYDPITETYDPRQTKIINSTIAITDDNWASTKTALGYFGYIDPRDDELKYAYGLNGETIVGKVILGGELAIANAKGSLKMDENGLEVTGQINGDEETGFTTFNTVRIDPNNPSIIQVDKYYAGETDDEFSKDTILSFNNKGDLQITGVITAKAIIFENNDDQKAAQDALGLSAVAISGQYTDLTGYFDGQYASLKFTHEDTPTFIKNGYCYVDLDFSGAPAVANTGSYTDLLNKPTIPTVTSIITSDDVAAASSKAVYDYAVPKSLGADYAGTLLYVDTNGNVTTISVSDLKTLLGV